MRKLIWLCTLLLAACAGPRPVFAWNPVTDVQQNLKWTVGEEAALGTAYKIAGSGEFKIGNRANSAMFGIFDYRFVKMSYGAITNPQNGERVGDGLKTGLMLNYFLGWFQSPQTPAMRLFNNVNLGPAVTVPLFSSSTPLKYPSVWLEANYQFGGNKASSYTSATPTPAVPVTSKLNLFWQETANG